MRSMQFEGRGPRWLDRVWSIHLGPLDLASTLTLQGSSGMTAVFYDRYRSSNSFSRS
jgi:hypothetical protein